MVQKIEIQIRIVEEKFYKRQKEANKKTDGKKRIPGWIKSKAFELISF